jgi:DNA-binding protein H-NS
LQELVMAKANLASMSVDALLKLRDSIGNILGQRADELKSQLSRLGGDAVGNGRRGRRGRRVSAMKGRKVPAKYRDPASGETWAGRGARPRWLVARLKTGKKLQDFLIDKSAKKARKKRRKKK